MLKVAWEGVMEGCDCLARSCSGIRFSEKSAVFCLVTWRFGFMINAGVGVCCFASFPVVHW